MVTDSEPAAAKRDKVPRSPLERIRWLGGSVQRISQIGLELTREHTGNPRFVARELTDPYEVLEARRFATSRFLELGKIEAEQVHQDGPQKGLLINDSLLDKSIFFGVYEGDELVATARFVWAKEMTVRDTRMPFDLLTTDMQNLLDEIPRGASAEFASLAKAEGCPNVATLKLIREMVHWSYRKDVQHFTSGLEPKVFPLYSCYFGGAVTRLHPETVKFVGIKGEQVPMIVDLGDSLEEGFDIQAKGPNNNLGARATQFAVRAFLRSEN